MKQAVAREWWDYDPETGLLTWRKAQSNRIRAGQEAGWTEKNQAGKLYRRLRLKGYGFPLAHRVIWVWMTGHWPTPSEEIDHEDGNGLHNWWKNLRLVSKAEQARNHRLQENNTTGTTGVYPGRNGRFHAQINIDGRRIYLGTFATIKEAKAARKTASQEHGFHLNHGQDRPL